MTQADLLSIESEDWRRLRKAWRAVRYLRNHPDRLNPVQIARERDHARRVAVQSGETMELLQSRIQDLGAVVGDLRTGVAVVRFFARQLTSKVLQNSLVVLL
jgi:hypothetical protein